MDLPIINKNKNTEENGLAIVKGIVEQEIGWIFRKVHLENDFGIDGYIDILQDRKYLTGKTIAVQIKTGQSYFKQEDSIGWTFYGENKHLNYYLNIEIPVIVVLVNDEENEAYWSLVDRDIISKTDKGWKISILKSQKLNDSTKLKETTKGFIDYSNQIQNLEKIKQTILEYDNVFIAIDRDEIETVDFSGFEKLLKWLTSSEKMVTENKGKFFISVFGYNDDPRELYEIEEVRSWFKKVLSIFKYWGYFLNMERETLEYSGMRLLRNFCVRIESVNYIKEQHGFDLELNIKEHKQFSECIIGWLNEFTETFNIQERINYEQTMKITQTIFNLPDDEMDMIIRENPLK